MRIVRGVVGFFGGAFLGFVSLFVIFLPIRMLSPSVMENHGLLIVISNLVIISSSVIGMVKGLSSARATQGGQLSDVTVRSNSPLEAGEKVWNVQMDYVGRGVANKGMDVQIKAETKESALEKAKSVAQELMEEKDKLESLHDCQISGIEIRKIERFQ